MLTGGLVPFLIKFFDSCGSSSFCFEVKGIGSLCVPAETIDKGGLRRTNEIIDDSFRWFFREIRIYLWNER